MFVYYFVHLNRPFGMVEPALVAQLNQLGSFANAAYREGEDLRDKNDRIALRNAHPAMAKIVQLLSGFR